MATADRVQEVYIAYYGRPADPDGLAFWVDQLEAAGGDLATIIDAFGNSDEFNERFGDDDAAALINNIYQNLFNRDSEAEGLEFYLGLLDDGVSLASIALRILDGADGDDVATLANKLAAANAFTAEVDASGTVYEGSDAADAANAWLAAIDADTDVDAVIGNISQIVQDTLPDTQPPGPTPPGPTPDPATFTLTQQADNITGTEGNDTFVAPVTQNMFGVLANTFETGDVLDGAGGRNVLKADLVGTGTVADVIAGAPISATTTNIQEVYLRSQQVNLVNTIDAERMNGVEQWWTDNSRSNITIEDIRSQTEDTAFGMRLTDPGVNYTAFFNALFLEGGLDIGESGFNFIIRELGNFGNELGDITVIGIRFELEGESFELGGADVEAANTWAELEAALQAQVDDAGLDGIAVTHRGNGQFSVVDPEGREFSIDPAGTVVSSSTVNEEKAAAPGAPDVIEQPTVTTVVLDGAGNGSQGGALNIGAMSGQRGVEVFDVLVDRDSHLTNMSSVNQVGTGSALIPNQFLEVVNLQSIGSEGDLTIGARLLAQVDGRVNTNGLVNVREVNGAEFAGSLNIGAQFTPAAIPRYLDLADDAVEFIYTGGSQDDIFNIADASGGAVSGDQDFSLAVDMGAGDDRLILNVPNVSNVSVDGGLGANSIVVSQSHGTTAANTFAEFSNFQTYEIEGILLNTQHDFTNMPGVEDVVIATVAPGGVGRNTQLINMEADQSVTVSGKNQTVLDSTADQNFGIIQLTNDQGTDRTVTLENAARLSNTVNGVREDGVLTINNLVVNSDATLSGTASAVRNLTIDSDGARNTGNAIEQLNAAAVNSLELVGTQDLSINVINMATAPAANQAPLNIDASALEGNLNLAVESENLNQITGAGNDVITGTAGDNDVLMFHGPLPFPVGSNPTVTGFEEIQFGTRGPSLFGDLQLGPQTANGVYNAANTNASVFNIANTGGLVLNNLGNGVEVNMGDANLNADGNVVNSQVLGAPITLNSGAPAGTPAAELAVNYLSNLLDSQTHTLTVGGYQTIEIDIAHAGNLTGAAGVSIGVDARTLNLTLDSDARVLKLTGGEDSGGFIDTLTLPAALANSLTTIDFSGYVGRIGAITLDPAAAVADQSNTAIVLNGYGANVTDTVADQITTFRFVTDAVAATEDWDITGFRGFNDAAVDLTNLSILDLRGLGVEGLADITIADVGADTVITSNAGLNFEITLVGILSAELSNENFVFAS